MRPSTSASPTYNTDDPTRWCMNYVAATTRPIAACRGISCRAVGDYDYCANKYNRYTADKIDSYDFRGNVGIVLMDFAAASHATMTFGQTYSNMQVLRRRPGRGRDLQQQQVEPAAQRITPGGSAAGTRPGRTPERHRRKTSRASREVFHPNINNTNNAMAE